MWHKHEKILAFGHLLAEVYENTFSPLRERRILMLQMGFAKDILLFFLHFLLLQS